MGRHDSSYEFCAHPSGGTVASNPDSTISKQTTFMGKSNAAAVVVELHSTTTASTFSVHPADTRIYDSSLIEW